MSSEFSIPLRGLLWVALVGLASFHPAAGVGQMRLAGEALPDAPAVASGLGGGQDARPRRSIAGPFDKTIDPGEAAPALRVGDKILLGLRATVAPIAISGWVGAASISEARDSRPNYPDTFGGFGQRLGAAAARSGSDTIITDSVLSSFLREDPRYYRLGVRYGVWKRTGYAVSRVFFTRTDFGTRTPNFALLIGDVAGASLTQLYYPHVNRGVGDVAKTYGVSLVGAGVGFFVREFSPRWLYAVHLRPDYN